MVGNQRLKEETPPTEICVCICVCNYKYKTNIHELGGTDTKVSKYRKVVTITPTPFEKERDSLFLFMKDVQ